jgi:hypothetical protein
MSVHQVVQQPAFGVVHPPLGMLLLLMTWAVFSVPTTSPADMLNR